MSYSEFITRKLSVVPPTGIAEPIDLRGDLFPHQSALTQWSIKRGRSAIFADTGLGKMRMELAWDGSTVFYGNADRDAYRQAAEQAAESSQKGYRKGALCD